MKTRRRAPYDALEAQARTALSVTWRIELTYSLSKDSLVCLTPSCLLVADLPKVCRAANIERESESTRVENTRRALKFSTSPNFISCVLDSLVFARGRPSKGRLTREFLLLGPYRPLAHIKKITPPARVAVPDDDRCGCWDVRGLERHGS